MVNMKVLHVFEANNFPFGVILIRTSLLSQKSVGLEEHGVARLLRLGRCCVLLGTRNTWQVPRAFRRRLLGTRGALARHPGKWSRARHSGQVSLSEGWSGRG